MIPKKIHYCWFGGNSLPEDAKKYIKTWKKYCPDYEIIEWNEKNFDVNCCPYVKEAYESKKWAFVSDYARFYILYKHGGIYFDTDVELIKPIDEIVSRGAFMGLESEKPIMVAPGLGLGAAAGLPIYKEILDFYNKRHFVNDCGEFDTTTVVVNVTNILKLNGLKNKNIIQNVRDIYVYPVEYFCPKSFDSGKLNITENTYSIHHFNGSWLTPWMSFRHKIKRILVNIVGKNDKYFEKRI